MVQREVFCGRGSNVFYLGELRVEEGNFKVVKSLVLNHDLGSVYALLGRSRVRRAANYVGSGMKYVLGTMDNDNEEYFQGVLQNLGDREDKLHRAMSI